MTTHPGPGDPEVVLRRLFGYPGFRPGQKALVQAALDGRDALGILPTGGGKSVCYQVPAAMMPGLTVVVSPLVSLMADQVRRAREIGLVADALHSGLTPEARSAVRERLKSRRSDLLLLAPERFASSRFSALVPHLGASLLTIDEAHCISMWGHDFRPAYHQLGGIRKALGCPMLALTATATPRVRREIELSLGMRRPVRVVGSFDRPNLVWAVRPIRDAGAKTRAFVELLKSFSGARLVYAATRGRVERIRDGVARRGVMAEAYHAGLAPEERTRVQEYFLSHPNPVVVATNAFGMGIDRADVRLVVHDQLPGSLEDYYQEAGRAGRDGAPALCVAFHRPADRRIHRAFLDRTHPSLAVRSRFWAERTILRRPSGPPHAPLRGSLARRRVGIAKLRGVHGYASTRRCRRQAILSWFGEPPRGGDCTGCDTCHGSHGVLKRAQSG